MRRDRAVEKNILEILRLRAQDCKIYEGYGTEFQQDAPDSKCKQLFVSTVFDFWVVNEIMK